MSLFVTFTGSRWCAYVSGGGAGGMLRELRDGKAAPWDRQLRAYVVTERVAGDLLALAEASGRRVQATGQTETEAEAQGALW